MNDVFVNFNPNHRRMRVRLGQHVRNHVGAIHATLNIELNLLSPIFDLRIMAANELWSGDLCKQ